MHSWCSLLCNDPMAKHYSMNLAAGNSVQGVIISAVPILDLSILNHFCYRHGINKKLGQR